MWIKFLASVLIVLTTTMIGYDFSMWLSKRKNSLSDLTCALTIFESEISFAANPLEIALMTTGSCLDSKVGEFFKSVSTAIKEQKEISIKKIFNVELKKFAPLLCLDKADIHILKSFFSTLGISNKENQLKSIIHTKSKLNIQLESAKACCIKNQRMYQSFGILSGLLISILLF